MRPRRERALPPHVFASGRGSAGDPCGNGEMHGSPAAKPFSHDLLGGHCFTQTLDCRTAAPERPPFNPPPQCLGDAWQSHGVSGLGLAYDGRTKSPSYPCWSGIGISCFCVLVGWDMQSWPQGKPATRVLFGGCAGGAVPPCVLRRSEPTGRTGIQAVPTMSLGVVVSNTKPIDLESLLP